MSEPRIDLPMTWPTEWDVPAFADGEMPQLVLDEGLRIIGRQKALIAAGLAASPSIPQLKSGLACYRVGALFLDHRRAIIEAIRQDRARMRGQR